MHLSSTIVAALMALTATTASPLDRRGNPAVSCQTSKASPSADGVDKAITVLGWGLNYGADKQQNTNTKHSDCSTILTEKDAAIAMCGGTEYVQTTDVINYITAIKDTCNVNGRVGGTYQVHPDLRIEVSFLMDLLLSEKE